MPKLHRKPLLFAVAFLAVGALVGSLVALNTNHAQASSGCSDNLKTHQVAIRDNQVSPQITDANLCEKITITNYDNVTREIAFGPHENHIPYDGIAEKILNKNQSFTITLVQAGMFHFHDHTHDEVMGYFNVYK